MQRRAQGNKAVTHRSKDLEKEKATNKLPASENFHLSVSCWQTEQQAKKATKAWRGEQGWKSSGKEQCKAREQTYGTA